MKLKLLNKSDDEEDLKMKENPTKLDFFKGFQQTSFFDNSLKEPLENDYNDKIYINTENNIFSVKNDNDKKEHKRFNIKNYEQIFKKNREKNFFTLKEENNAEIIKNIFDLIIAKKKKKENFVNKTIFTSKDKNKLAKYTNYNTFTNPNSIRMISEKFKKKTINDINSNSSYEEDYNKNKTLIPNVKPLYHKTPVLTLAENRILFPNINLIRKEIISLDSEAKNFNKNFKTKIKFGFNSKNNKKNKFNITLIKPNKLTMDNLDFNEEEKKKNYIKNKKNINLFIKKLNNFQYKNNLINKFFAEKREDVKFTKKSVPKIKTRFEENDEYYYLRKKSKVKPNPILNKFNIIKQMFKSQVDKEIFNTFNKKI